MFCPQYDTKLEKKKLFVKNLPFTVTRDALLTMFQEVRPSDPAMLGGGPGGGGDSDVGWRAGGGGDGALGLRAGGRDGVVGLRAAGETHV